MTDSSDRIGADTSTGSTGGDPLPGLDDVEAGTYDLLRARLETAAHDLAARAARLNDDRLDRYGTSRFEPVGSERIRTENNCVPRDVVAVGSFLLFGYNVFIGLRSETSVADVLSVHRFEHDDERFRFDPVGHDGLPGLLDDPAFVADFREVYTYYKGAQLLGLHRPEGRLLAVFRTGETLDDLRVFRWTVDPDGAVTYIDNRGERDYAFPPPYDFEWTETTRDDHVQGRQPHVNILDQLFVETVGGDLSVKVENNTESGEIVYREPVVEATQALGDASIAYARAGGLILVRVLPYKEKASRYLVFTPRTGDIRRVDAIGLACQQLPEDHGIIFPGGYHLESGETKTFDTDVSSMVFKEIVRSPNGEDVLYAFHDQMAGRSILLSYNMIRREIAPPISCHGYSRFDDGTIVVFHVESDEPTRTHRMQVWATPYVDPDFAASQPMGTSFLDTIGNAELVRSISDLYSVCHLVERAQPSVPVYERLLDECHRVSDVYFWLGDEHAHRLSEPLAAVRATGELVLAEFARAEALRAEAVVAVERAEARVDQVTKQLQLDPPATIEAHVGALLALRREQGHLITVRDVRYADQERLSELEHRVLAAFGSVADHTATFLADDEAFAPYQQTLDGLATRVGELATSAESNETGSELRELTDGLEVLAEVVAGLDVDDPTVRTSILERVSGVFARANRVRATLDNRHAELRRHESAAAFGAELLVFQQSVQSALAVASTPESCDDQLTRLLTHVEGLTARFADTEEFAVQLDEARDDVHEALTARKQTLLDERQRRTDRLATTGTRVIGTIRRRAETFETIDDINAFFAGDPMTGRVREVVGQLRELGDPVRADELETQLKAARQEAGRLQRDRADLFDDAATIRLGSRRFSVNEQPLDVTLVPGPDDTMDVALTGTDYRHPVLDDAFLTTRDCWNQLVVSENHEVYRAEYLAASILSELDPTATNLQPDELARLVKRAAEDRYEEGYEPGVHDHDATLILEAVLRLRSTAGLLRFPGPDRATALLWWTFGQDDDQREMWERRCRSLATVQHAFGPSAARHDLAAELTGEVRQFAMAVPSISRTANRTSLVALRPSANRIVAEPLADVDHGELGGARNGTGVGPSGDYLVDELATGAREIAATGAAVELRDRLFAHLDQAGIRRTFGDDLAALDLDNRHQLASAWITALLETVDTADRARLGSAAAEAIALVLLGDAVTVVASHALDRIVVKGLLGRHPRVARAELEVRLDDFLSRTDQFRRERVPAFRRYQHARHELLEGERRDLRLTELAPRVLSTFVRNQLIDKVYLPLLGDNFAKQLGEAGEGGRTDRMGLLLVVSPPGYGKTTLIEYVAGRLGLALVKINGPAIGSSVTSIDPAHAPDASSRRELEKINLALEMGNNVMLYLDDIQHIHPELLQRFIALCDAQRRMEGVWRGQSRTYDLRGKRFAVVMAGNPYTESGDRFQIPDMLANRADTYNLGDVLSGNADLFELSFLENALTSNPVLAPLAGRDPGDLPLLLRMADGDVVPADQLRHPYARAELEEVLAVLRHLVHIRSVVLAVNHSYIASAAQDHAFRTEPTFRLQGSYRNMNRLAEKVLPAMEPAEVDALIDDHYRGEAQTLTSDAEQNLLKLAELRGRLTEAEEQRWNEILQSYRRRVSLGSDDDPTDRIVMQLARLADGISALGGGSGA